MEDRLAELTRQVAELTARIYHIEQKLDLRPSPPAAPASVPPAEPRLAVPLPAPLPAADEQRGWEVVPANVHEPAVQPAQARLVPYEQPGTPPPPGTTDRDWEFDFGQRWLAWIGAVVLVVAAALFIRLAAEQGWLARLSPTFRCLATAAFGAALLVVGEVALRRIGRFAAVGLYSAGLGVLYLTALASFHLFKLAPGPVAFALMAGVTALGIGITLRGALLSVGCLSLLGGFAAPLLLGERSSSPVVFPAYLTLLLATSLALSLYRATPFRTLRYVGIGLLALVATPWLHTETGAPLVLTLAFLTGWWLMVCAEAFRAAARGESPKGNAAATFLFTAWFLVSGVDAVARTTSGNPVTLGTFALLIGLLSMWAAFGMGLGLGALRTDGATSEPAGSDAPRWNALRALTLAYWLQVGVALAAAIGLYFKQQEQSFGQTIGWLAMAGLLAELAARLNAPAVARFAVPVLLLALVRVIGVDQQSTVLARVLATLPGGALTLWGLLALGAAATTVWVAHRIQPVLKAERGWLPAALLWLAALVWLVFASEQFSGRIEWTVWAGGAVLLAAIAYLRPGLSATAPGIALTLIALLPWLAERLKLLEAPTAPGGRAALVWELVTGALLAVTLVWIHRIWLRDARLPRTDDTELPATLKPNFRWLLIEAPLLTAIVVGVVLAGSELAYVIESAMATKSTGYASPLALSATLAVAGAAAAFWGYRFRLIFGSGVLLLGLGIFNWLTIGTIGQRMGHDAPLEPLPLINWQFAVATVLVCGCLVAAWLLRRLPLTIANYYQSQPLLWGSGIAIGLIGLWAGSFEIDRAMHTWGLAHSPHGAHAAISVYWSLYAIALIVLGFRWGEQRVRHAGLGLFMVTLLKLLVVDLNDLDGLMRVLALLGVGLVLVGASVIYARVAARVAVRE